MTLLTEAERSSGIECLRLTVEKRLPSSGIIAVSERLCRVAAMPPRLSPICPSRLGLRGDADEEIKGEAR